MKWSPDGTARRDRLPRWLEARDQQAQAPARPGFRPRKSAKAPDPAPAPDAPPSPPAP